MLPFCECNSVRISQNIQNEVSLERSIFADVVAYQFINLNRKLNGSRKENIHRSMWKEACLVYGKVMKGRLVRKDSLFSNWSYLNGLNNPS